MTRTGYKAIRGFSLVELMISIALGLIILTAITSLTVKSLDSSNDLARMTRLEQEMRGILQVMARDLKRAGFMSYEGLVGFIGNGPVYNNPFQTFQANALGDTAGIIRCVSYSYDRDENGILTEDASAAGLTGNEPQETFGFRFDAVNNAIAIESLSGPVDPLTLQNCTDNDANWQDISDDSRVTITDLRFVVNPTNVDIPNTAGPLGNPAIITQRQVLISITGELSDDTFVTRTLHESVKLRNHEFTPPS